MNANRTMGSNQYATRGTPTAARSNTAVVAGSAKTPEPDDTEQVAWAFHPDSERWRAVGVMTEREMLTWKSVRATTGAVREAIDAGLTADEASEWVNGLGIELFSVYTFRAQGFTPDEARPWVQAGVAGTKAAQWRSMSVAPTDAAAWDEQRLPGGGFAWRHMTDLGPAACKWWATNGFDSPVEVSGWVAAGLTDPREATRWRNTGAPPEVCAGWIAAGYIADEAGWRIRDGQEAP